MEFWDYDPLTGMKRYLGWDNDKDALVVKHEQDTTAIIESNKEFLRDANHAKHRKQEWSRYARVPNIVQMEWKTKYGVDFYNPDHWQRVMQLINSPEYRDLKTSPIYHDR